MYICEQDIDLIFLYRYFLTIHLLLFHIRHCHR